MIIDIAKYQGAVNWDALAPALDFIVKIRTNGQVVTALGSGTFSGHIIVAGTYVV